MGSWGSKIMASTLSVCLPMLALGLLTTWLLFSEIDQVKISHGCPDSLSFSFRLGHHEVDKFLCALVQFFKHLRKSNEGIWVLGYLLSVALSAFTFVGLEASRYGSSWLLSLTPLFGILMQAIGISVVVPLIWLPIYFMSRKQQQQQQPDAMKISVVRVAALKFGIMLLELEGVAMLLHFDRLNEDIIPYLFQPAPILLPLLWLPFITTEVANAEAGHKSVMLVHLLGAGLGLAWHFVGLLFVFDDPSIPSKVMQLLWNHQGHDWCTYFLIVDCIVTLVAFVYLAAVEDGLIVVLAILVGSIAMGPAAALSLYFVYREYKMLQRVSKGHLKLQ